MDEENQIPLPFEERFRLAEQLALHLKEVPEPQPKPSIDYAMDTVCIQNCNACKHCDNN